MGTVELDGVGKSFGEVEVLRDIRLDIAEGEFVVLVGPSGCGKSTLLRLIAGLEDVTAGCIRIAGRDVTALEPYDRGLSMVFQFYVSFNPTHKARARKHRASALETRPANPAPRSSARCRGRADAPARAGCGPAPSDSLGGQRQRVAHRPVHRARAQPRFLSTRPLSNLDASLPGRDADEPRGRFHRKAQ